MGIVVWKNRLAPTEASLRDLGQAPMWWRIVLEEPDDSSVFAANNELHAEVPVGLPTRRHEFVRTHQASRFR